MLIRRWQTLGSLLLWVTLAAGQAWGQEATPATLWTDFNHYVRIARPDLAKASATQLLKVDEQALLDAVEASEYRDSYQATLARAGKTEGLKELSQQLADRIQAARIKLSRDPQRIQADIRKLAGGPRERINATERLRAAGQFAAPFLVKTLLDDSQQELHPFALNAMIAIGRPMAYPLSVALPHIDARPMGQIAQALAEIGYPRAIPYLKQVIDNPRTDRDARVLVEAALNKLAGQSTLTAVREPAAQLFLALGRNYYTAATANHALPGYDEELQQGIIWVYTKETGLVDIRVPGPIFGDVLAMRAATQALALDPTLDQALSLWLTANVRREIRLPKGQVDPSYAQNLQLAGFYLMMAGPMRQFDVLQRALLDADSAVALAALQALDDTAGTQNLINQPGGADPLLKALYSIDRRIRIKAGLVLANAHPRNPFSGSDRVVRVLGEALRQVEVKYALVIAPEQEAINKIQTTLKDVGYQTISGRSLAEANAQIDVVPGVDLIVALLPVEPVTALAKQAGDDYRLAGVPLLNITTTADQIEIARRFDGQLRAPLAINASDAKTIEQGIAQLKKAYGCQDMSTKQAADYTQAALSALKDIGLSQSGVFKIADAQSALIRTMADNRTEVVHVAAEVLAMIDSPDAQRAIAQVALDANRPEESRIQLLASLATSATNFGNKLNEVQLENISSMVKSSKGPLALVAARTYGALTLPTSNVVQMIAQ